MSRSLLVLAVLGIATLGFAQTRPPLVAVLPLSGRGLDSNNVGILEDGLAKSLLGTGKVRLLERSQMAGILQEQGFQESGTCEGSECAVKVGKLLGVERGVVGSIGRLGQSYVLTLRMIDIGTGEVLAASQRSSSGTLEQVLDETVPLAANDLLGVKRAASSKAWIWWTAGGATLAGGAGVAALLLSGKHGAKVDAEPAATPLGSLEVGW